MADVGYLGMQSAEERGALVLNTGKGWQIEVWTETFKEREYLSVAQFRLTRTGWVCRKKLMVPKFRVPELVGWLSEQFGSPGNPWAEE